MGFDNECILNIQSLAGEYFCPVCRLLVYPNEALQSQCTHLYCKPCLTYVVSTTRACPYDGYLVTAEDSKPLIESNKALAETIGKIVVQCLYHRSGCTWQGPLTDCITHCSGCEFGNSPVVCNRCGIQIVHHQVQEHAQNCPGVQSQAQQAGTTQDTSTSGTAPAINQNQPATQSGAYTPQVQASQTTAVPTVPEQVSNQPGNSSSQGQALSQSTTLTPEQWYLQQQQYQQYYQQYPGNDPYQQLSQQYYPYQQSTTESQTSATTQPQNHVQFNTQQQLYPSGDAHSQIPPQTHPSSLSHSHPLHPSYAQAQPHLQQSAQTLHYQQSHPHMQNQQRQVQQQAHPQQQPQQSQHLTLPQTQIAPHNQPMNTNIQPWMQNPQAVAMTGHHSYSQPQAHQQMHTGGSQSTMETPVGSLLTSHAPQLLVPFHAQLPGQTGNQQPAMHSVQQTLSQQNVQQKQHNAHHGQYIQQQVPIVSHLGSRVLPPSFAQHSPGYMHPNPTLSHKMQQNQSQNLVRGDTVELKSVKSEAETNSIDQEHSLTGKVKSANVTIGSELLDGESGKPLTKETDVKRKAKESAFEHSDVDKLGDGIAEDLKGQPGLHGPHPAHHIGNEMFPNLRPDDRRFDFHIPGSAEPGPRHLAAMHMRANVAPGFESSLTPGLIDEKFKLMDTERLKPGVHRPNHDSDLQLDSLGGGAAASRFFPPHSLDSSFHPSYERRNVTGRTDPAHGRREFLGSGPGYPWHHVDSLGPRSTFQDYHRINLRGFSGRPGLGDPAYSFHESRFPFLSRSGFDSPVNFSMVEHLRSGEFIGRDRHLDLGGVSGHLDGLGSFEPFGGGKPGFRSSFSLQRFPEDSRIYSGDKEASGTSWRKRRSVSMGWCRICKVECETVEGLDLHSQTRDHQKMAMDMVQSIKQNAKKQKLAASENPLSEDANPPTNGDVGGEGKSIK